MTAYERLPLRVIQWTTGNVARQGVRAAVARSDLQLVGVYEHSEASPGKGGTRLPTVSTRLTPPLRA